MNSPYTHVRTPKGFALVVTISLLVLLSVIALGFLSLSAVTLRSGSHDQAQMEARANARLALQIAIGELQKQTGSDTRVTAPADIVETGAPRITGVWRSWEGLNHEKTGSAAGRPKTPNYGIKTEPYDPNAEETGRFLTWLVSSAKIGENIDNPSVLAWTNTDANSVPPEDYVALLAKGTLGENKYGQELYLKPQKVKDNTGAIAWWVSPENQKARLAQPYSPRTADVAGLAEMGQTHTITNPGAFGLASLAEDPESHKPDANAPKAARKAITRETMALLAEENPAEPEKKFHDLTTYSNGLLTNTATGGWRKDLSILTEKWDAIYAAYPGGKLPLFRYAPTAGTSTSLVPKPVKPAANVPNTNMAAVTNATPNMSNLYPWSNYSIIIPPPPNVVSRPFPNTYHAAAASWESLKSFVTAYKGFSYSSGVVTKPNSFGWDSIANQRSDLPVLKIYNFKHTQRLYPHIARFQFVVYVSAVMTLNDPDPSRRRYQLVYKLVPFFTLWNPYNVALEHTVIGGSQGFGDGSNKHANFLGFGWRRSPPGAMAVVSSTTFPNPVLVPNSQYRLFTPGNFQVLDAFPGMFGNNANPYDTGLPGQPYTQRWVDKRTFGCWLPEGTITFKPGEVKMFSPGWSDPAYGLSGVLRLREGYHAGPIIGSDFNGQGNLQSSQRFWFLYKTDRITQPYLGRPPGNGFSLSFGTGAAHFGANGTMPTGIGDEFHNVTALTNVNQGNKYWPPTEVDEIQYSVGELVGLWTPLFSSSFGPRMTIGTGPGTEQNRPTKGAVQNNALAAMVLSNPGSGASKDHPANNTFDFAYHSLSMQSTLTPNLSDSKGFIATGYQSGDGLSRIVLVDIPLRPMASLIELQGWNPRGGNPYPPFQMNLIGNSDATPTIPKDQIVPSVLEPAGVNFNLMHDDSYCANHLLFDDWFLSTIAPDPDGFGSNSVTSVEDVYDGFLRGSRALPNRAYQPIAADTNLSDTEVAERKAQILNHPEGWLKSASRFQVEGMFNINSTSVEAWKALLGRAKNIEQIAMYGANEIEAKEVSKKHVLTRGAVATDIEAGTGPGFGGQFNNASEYNGFRTLSDDQIEDLSKKVVDQVRLRGPFLSLAEFMNRHLVNNDSVALEGAVQTAINNLSLDPMATLRNPANFLSDTTMNPEDDKLDGVGYAYEKAAEGDSAYGAPGWIRQADVLRSIAPILSARDDTFTIRAYGDARDATGKVTARAWCEAVVSRTRDFVNQADAADSIDPPVNQDSIRYGRRYEMVSFRWLNADDV